MNRNFILLLFSFVSIALSGTVPRSQNSPQDYISMARDALSRKDYDRVIQYADMYAERHNNSYSALNDVAEQMRKDASSIYPNDKKAFLKPLEYAARMGNAHALFSLGCQYCSGQFVPKDEPRGLALLKASEELGYPRAADMYRQLKTSFDLEAAYNRVLQEKQQMYNDQVLRAVATGVLITAIASIIGNGIKASASNSGRGYYSGNQGSSSNGKQGTSGSSGKEKQGSSSDVDVESIGMPKYTWTTDWYKETLLPPGGVPTNTSGENQARKIKFEGVGTSMIKRVIGSEGYWCSGRRYKTLDDAIIAEYVNLKYGKVREKGRMSVWSL